MPGRGCQEGKEKMLDTQPTLNRSTNTYLLETDWYAEMGMMEHLFFDLLELLIQIC